MKSDSEKFLAVSKSLKRKSRQLSTKIPEEKIYYKLILDDKIEFG